MAQIIITIPDAVANRVRDGFCQHYGYSPILENGSPNPETKMQFVKRKLLEVIKQAVRRAEIENASNQAAGIAGQAVDSEIVIS